MRMYGQERFLYHLKIAIKTLLRFDGCAKKFFFFKSIMADLYTTQPRSVSSRPSRQFLEALLLRKAGQTLMLTGRQSESYHS